METAGGEMTGWGVEFGAEVEEEGGVVPAEAGWEAGHEVGGEVLEEGGVECGLTEGAGEEVVKELGPAGSVLEGDAVL